MAAPQGYAGAAPAYNAYGGAGGAYFSGQQQFSQQQIPMTYGQQPTYAAPTAQRPAITGFGTTANMFGAPPMNFDFAPLTTAVPSYTAPMVVGMTSQQPAMAQVAPMMNRGPPVQTYSAPGPGLVMQEPDPDDDPNRLPTFVKVRGLPAEHDPRIVRRPSKKKTRRNAACCA